VSPNISSFEHVGETAPAFELLGSAQPKSPPRMTAEQYVALVFSLEVLLFTFFRVSQTTGSGVNGFAIVDTEWKAQLLRAGSAGLLTFIAGLLAVSRERHTLVGMFKSRISVPLLALHILAVIGSATIPVLYFWAVPSTPPAVISLMRLLGITLAGLFGFLSLFSIGGLIRTLWSAGAAVWLSSVFVAGVINPLTQAVWSISSPLATFTFRFVHALLRPLLPNLILQPNQKIIGTQAFSVRIAPGCSGLEGLILIFLLSAFCLVLFRRSYRFPRALLILPIGMAAVWIMNSFRIAILVLIGEKASPAVAVNGFHSQAGWIAFASIAFVMWFALQRITWFAAFPAWQPSAPSKDRLRENAAAPYVVPMLVLLIASCVSRAVSAYFAWLYPVEVLATAIALWHYRVEYRSLRQGWSWPAVATGVAIFAVWIALAVFYAPAQRTTDSVALAHFSPLARGAWVGVRFAGKTLIEPLAQTLALFGFLARRLQSSDFETVSFSGLRLNSILLCAALAGAIHLNSWAAALVASLITGLFLQRTGKLGSAIVANAVAGALTALVFAFGK
jgi:exosortase E/protease (VPEID-CTERM system)